MLTQEFLKSQLHYNQETGVFTRIVQSSNFIKVGDVAGSINKGRRLLLVCGKRYFAHRLAWLYVYGKWPEHVIDHIDGNPDNNSINNLRDVPHCINLQNKRAPNKNNKSGFLGVIKSKAKIKQGWIARIILNKKTITIGTFNTPELAHSAYIEAKRKIHEGCTI